MNTLDELVDERFTLKKRLHMLRIKSQHARLAEQEARDDYEDAVLRVREYWRLRALEDPAGRGLT